MPSFLVLMALGGVIVYQSRSPHISSFQLSLLQWRRSWATVYLQPYSQPRNNGGYCGIELLKGQEQKNNCIRFFSVFEFRGLLTLSPPLQQSLLHSEFWVDFPSCNAKCWISFNRVKHRADIFMLGAGETKIPPRSIGDLYYIHYNLLLLCYM